MLAWGGQRHTLPCSQCARLRRTMGRTQTTVLSRMNEYAARTLHDTRSVNGVAGLRGAPPHPQPAHNVAPHKAVCPSHSPLHNEAQQNANARDVGLQAHDGAAKPINELKQVEAADATIDLCSAISVVTPDSINDAGSQV